MGDVTVELSRTYGETNKQVSKLVFRTPKWRDYIDIGDIQEWQPLDKTGERLMHVRHFDAVEQYAERLLQEPATPADLAVLDLVDALKVEAAIAGFFKSARSSNPKPTDSSGDTEKDSAKSET